ncbi:MAG TPA: hypothetical protein VEO54_12920 [Thermoanaerobaculia bacterium]|nr:hypothetical protein [Thermoanaerobaculia bacterium]
MGKIHFSNDLQKQRTSRSLLAVSLAASLAAFGCTTNLNPGNGIPTRSGPELRSAPTSGVTSGSERVTTTPQPMTSSYNSAQVLPTVKPRTITRRSPEEAAAIMAGRQTLRGRYLGQVNPGPGNRPYVSDYAGGFQNPALITNPQLTINSSISSPAPGSIGNADFAGVNMGAVTNGINTTAGTTTTTFTTGTTGTTAASTVTGTALPAGSFATVRPAATEAISNNPTVTGASAGIGRAGIPVTGTTSAVTTTAAATTATTATAAATARPTVTEASVSGGVRIVRGSAGAVTITNTGTAATGNQQ